MKDKKGCPTCNGVDPKSCLRCKGKTRLSDWEKLYTSADLEAAKAEARKDMAIKIKAYACNGFSLAGKMYIQIDEAVIDAIAEGREP